MNDTLVFHRCTKNVMDYFLVEKEVHHLMIIDRDMKTSKVAYRAQKEEDFHHIEARWAM